MFLDIQEVIDIHDEIVNTTGGLLGLRDCSLLQSALARPFTEYYEAPMQQATALFESLLYNHAFLDGNKRTALALLDIFLKRHLLVLDVDARDCIEFLDTLFSEKTKKENRFLIILEWIKSNTIDYIEVSI